MITDILLMLLLLTIAFLIGYFAAMYQISNRVSDILVGAHNMLKMEHITKTACLRFMGRLHTSLNGISRYQPRNAHREMIEYLASDEIHEPDAELEIVST